MPLSLHDGTPEQVAEKTFTKQYTRQILWISKTICKNDSMITLVSINEKLKSSSDTAFLKKWYLEKQFLIHRDFPVSKC